jgi:hypothetical protein
MDRNDNTLLWLAVLGLGAWVWYIQNNQPVYFFGGRMGQPVPYSSLNPTQQAAYQAQLTATQPGGPLDQNVPVANSTGQTTQPVTGTPVTVSQTSINGMGGRRLRNIAR